jgi:predicted transcriptional regulator
MHLDKIIGSPVHLKILKFFHENQASIDTPRGVATWVDEERAKVKKVLEDLVESGILVAHRATSITGYSYTNDPKLISKISRLLEKAPRAQ